MHQGILQQIKALKESFIFHSYQWCLHWGLNKISNSCVRVTVNIPMEYSQIKWWPFFSMQKCDTLGVNKLLLQKPGAAAELIPFTHLQHVGCLWKVSLTMWQNRCVCVSFCLLSVYHRWWGENNSGKNICFEAFSHFPPVNLIYLFLLKKTD